MKKSWFLATFVALFSVLSIHAQTGYQVGDEAIDFSLKNIDGKMVSMEDYPDADGFIVIFTCNTCPFAQMYEDRINELDAEFKAKGYPVIAINPNDPVRKPGDSFEAMQARTDEKGFTFPYLVDETQAITQAYGATKTPHVYLLQKNDDGKKIVRYIGAIDNNAYAANDADKRYVSDAINELEGGQEVSKSVTKAIGCGIKWKLQ